MKLLCCPGFAGMIASRLHWWVWVGALVYMGRCIGGGMGRSMGRRVAQMEDESWPIRM